MSGAWQPCRADDPGTRVALASCVFERRSLRRTSLAARLYSLSALVAGGIFVLVFAGWQPACRGQEGTPGLLSAPQEVTLVEVPEEVWDKHFRGESVSFDQYGRAQSQAAPRIHVYGFDPSTRQVSWGIEDWGWRPFTSRRSAGDPPEVAAVSGVRRTLVSAKVFIGEKQIDTKGIQGAPGPSADGHGCGFCFMRDGNRFVWFDGKERELFQLSSDPERVLFGPAAERVAVVLETPDKTSVIVDGKAIGGSFDRISNLAFSKDGRKLAFAGRRTVVEPPGQTIVELGGQRMAIPTGGPRWKFFVLVDEKEMGPYSSEIDAIALSPKGEHVAFLTKGNDRKYVLYVDGEPQNMRFQPPPAESAPAGLDRFAIRINPNGDVFLFSVQREWKDNERKCRLWVNGRLTGNYEEVFAISTDFDGNAFWFIAGRKAKLLLVKQPLTLGG